MTDPFRTVDVSPSIYQVFLQTADRDPHATAWLAGNTSESRPRWRWSELVDQVQSAAAWLLDVNVAPGDRVANVGRNTAEWAILDLACSAIGAIHAPLDPRLPDSALMEALKQLEPKALFASDPTRVPRSQSLADLGHVSHPPAPQRRRAWERPILANDPACILFTSGTTDIPRGVMLSHRNLLSNAVAKLDAMPQSADDLRLNILPFAHAYARTCELTTWVVSGGTMACAHSMEDALRVAPQLQPSLLNGVPAFFEGLHARWQPPHGSGHPLARLLGEGIRRLASGGAPLAEPLRRAFNEVDLPIYQGYGLTEASPVVCSNRAPSNQSAAEMRGVGPAVDGVTIRVDAEQRVWVRGAGIMIGYWRSADATAAKIQEGWLDTGDIAAPCESLDAPHEDTQARTSSSGAMPTGAKPVGASPVVNRPDGTHRGPLWIEGRCDDVQVLSNGYKFSPRPIEARITQRTEIERCVLVGNRRKRPVLVVRMHPSYTHLSPGEVLLIALETLDGVPEYAKPDQVQIDAEPWSVRNGRMHWKGTVDRRAIERMVR
jgi:long-chain acyl-CoA synthetase